MKIYYFSPPTAILGLHQAVPDVDLAYLRQNTLTLNRRLTGGGAILLGLPNAYSQIGITIVARTEANLPANLRGKFDYFTPIIRDALKNVGLQPEIDNNFNIVIGSKKIAGTGIYAEESAFLFHTMILLDCDYRATARVLKIPPSSSLEVIVQNMREKVTTVLHELGNNIDYKDVETALIESLSRIVGESVEEGHYFEREITESETLLKAKYSSQDWILGASDTGSNVGACFVPFTLPNPEKKG
jgi:lipoate-protein ligase A